MVFKNKLFFSSKKSDPSSPGRSFNSPRSIGSNSPVRSDKKKEPKSSSSFSSKNVRPSTSASGGSPATASFKQTHVKDGAKKKDAVKGKQSIQTQSQTPTRSGQYVSVSKSKKTAAAVGEKETAPASAVGSSMSLILASSLGLNKIKTRSGPLPQESFFGFRGEKGSSNLSRPGGGDGGSSSSNSVSGNKKEAVGQSRTIGFQQSRFDNGGKWDSISTGNGQSSEVSPSFQARMPLQNGESSTDTGQHKSSQGFSGGLRSSDVFTPETYDCENPKETESPCFQAILQVTSAPRKRFPADIKSFSHELNSKGVRPFPFWKPRGQNNLEEILVVIHAKFDKAKEEVNSDLAIFSADLVGIPEKNAESHPEWQETIEDLLVMARSCAMTSPGDFWLQCEGIVKKLDNKRQELPPGMLKQLYTQMLFILTRCTRLLQFHKESRLHEEENVFQLCQSRVLHSADKQIPSGIGRDGKGSGAANASKADVRKSHSQEQWGLDWRRDQIMQPGNLLFPTDGTSKNAVSPGSQDQISSWKKLPSPAATPGKTMKEVASSKKVNDSKVESVQTLNRKRGASDTNLTYPKSSEPPTAKDSHEQFTYKAPTQSFLGSLGRPAEYC